MNAYVATLRRILGRHAQRDGQGMVEYGLIIALVAIVAIAGLVVLGPTISQMFTALSSSV